MLSAVLEIHSVTPTFSETVTQKAPGHIVRWYPWENAFSEPQHYSWYLQDAVLFDDTGASHLRLHEDWALGRDHRP